MRVWTLALRGALLVLPLSILEVVLCGVLCGVARADDPFDYFRNSWNVIGLRDYAHGTRITADNQLVLAEDVRVRLRFGPQLERLGSRHVKTLLEGWLPIVLIAADDRAVRYEFTLWATPLPTVEDWRKAFDAPVAGDNFLNWIAIKAINTGSVPAAAKVSIERGDASRAPSRELSWGLAPGTAVEDCVCIPFTPLEAAVTFDGRDAALWLDRTRQYWRDLVLGAARIEVPCRKATDALLAAHVCQLIASDRGELHAGEGFYDEFYIRDAGYQIMELEEAGLFDAAANAVVPYLRAQRPDGRFETQANQLDANGQALWVLWQYFKITGDRSWLAEAYPAMRRSVDWIRGARRDAPADSPFAGLLPAAPADGEYLWDGTHHIVGYDFWNLRGLLCTADAARLLGQTDEAEDLLREARDYRHAIDSAWERAGLAHFPPSWEGAGTHWGNTETLWPTPIFAPEDPRVTALIDHARRVQGGGFTEGTIRWIGLPDVIHPYLSAYTTMASLVRDEHEAVVADFFWYLLHSTAAHAFPEGIYFKRRFAWGHTIPHATGASNYALLLRHMLVHEQGSELHLLKGAADEWLTEGKEIRVERAPTHFGEISLAVQGEAEGVRVSLERPTREPPSRIVLHLPASRPLLSALDGVQVAARSDQVQAWDFASAVATYEAAAPPLSPPIPSLVPFPLEKRLPRERCMLLDLTGIANTDPFTAPFGVPQPGKYVFKGLTTGTTTVAGVRFSIIDPKQNGGRAFVVLHSPLAPSDRKWPAQVEIPVQAGGRRLFFLGNVHGWAAQDAGEGPWGAVAEYVIHYADGEEQTVPLITGRTADDWAMPPDAEEVIPALRGDPWHLNVLGVTLRPVMVEKIVFRDLGTAAAPVLVAVTLER
ncbi:MAG: hypothetical protein AB1486_07135 [Planctomycetota bacterium]